MLVQPLGTALPFAFDSSVALYKPMLQLYRDAYLLSGKPLLVQGTNAVYQQSYGLNTHCLAHACYRTACLPAATAWQQSPNGVTGHEQYIICIPHSADCQHGPDRFIVKQILRIMPLLLRNRIKLVLDVDQRCGKIEVSVRCALWPCYISKP